jgi:hypothetical protein
MTPTFEAQLASNEEYSVLFAFFKLSFEVIKLLSTTLKAFKISDDTFNAKRAVNTRYIRLIIFCRGSAGKAITSCINYFYEYCLVCCNSKMGSEDYFPTCIALSMFP